MHGAVAQRWEVCVCVCVDFCGVVRLEGDVDGV